MLSNKALSASGGGTGITYVGGYTTGFEGSTSNITITFGGNLTGGISASALEGDLVLVYYGIATTAAEEFLDSGAQISGYSGFVFLRSLSDRDDTILRCAYKVMGSTPDTTFVLTNGTSSLSDAGAVAVQVWRNVDANLPLDSLLTATGIDSVLCNPPAITPNNTGAYIVSGGAGAHRAGAQTFSSSDLTGFISSGFNDSNDATIGLGYKQWTSGSFDPAAFTFSGTDNTPYSWAAATLALRPLGTVRAVGSYTETRTNTATNTSYTFDNCNIGTASADRRVVVVVQHTKSESISSLTIGGVTATLDYNVSATRFVGFASLTVTTGTTANIVVTMTGSVDNMVISIYTITGLSSTTPIEALAATVTSGTVSTISTLDVEQGGVVIAAVTGSDINAYTFSGVDEQYDATIESGQRAATGYAQTYATSTSYTVSATSALTQSSRLVAVSWK